MQDDSLLWPPASRNGEPLVMVSEQKREWGNALRDFLSSQGSPWDQSVAFATSGSSGGRPKAVIFSPAALEASARSVNEWIGASLGGDWCCPLPVWHMGGFMIHVRAALTGVRVFSLSGRWEASQYVRLLEECRASWSALVPAQVVDLVNAGFRAPATIKCIIVGGGALSPTVGEQARALGWPVVQSYGMTEAASQIATARLDEPYTGEEIPVLPHWELKLSESGCLCLRGKARFSAYAKTNEEGAFYLELFSPDEWWGSHDVVELKDARLTFLRRADRVIKILGELVDVDELENRFSLLCPGSLLVPLTDKRRGARLYACSENSCLAEAVEKWNEQEGGLYRLSGSFVMEIPRNPMEKLDRGTLMKRLKEKLPGS